MLFGRAAPDRAGARRYHRRGRIAQERVPTIEEPERAGARPYHRSAGARPSYQCGLWWEG